MNRKTMLIEALLAALEMPNDPPASDLPASDLPASDRPTERQPYVVGKDYLIRTVTHINIGTVIQVGPMEIVMTDASWIADTGRWANALATGELLEVEPYPEGESVIIGRTAVVDATRWLHPLPREVL